MKYARLMEGLVADVVSTDPAELFHPLIAAEFVEAPDDVAPGWTLNGADWLPPVMCETPVTPVAPIQMAVIDFLRLFTGPELDAFNALQARCNALTPAEYAAAAEGDQAKMALVGFKRFLTFYDALRAGLIELNHPDTILGLGLLVPSGVLTPARLEQVLAGEPPA
ncbi:hypothetical protein [uncultured Brevundimonas sp.]|uniref:hypothetical protein n=1 Tax=uncultured Brevundimonas sp. TaxID=213418 RepID=UPI0025E174FF|nr:hypothetical protein [uncultured Brevundimonas sp.]